MPNITLLAIPDNPNVFIGYSRYEKRDSISDAQWRELAGKIERCIFDPVRSHFRFCTCCNSMIRFAWDPTEVGVAIHRLSEIQDGEERNRIEDINSFAIEQILSLQLAEGPNRMPSLIILTLACKEGVISEQTKGRLQTKFDLVPTLQEMCQLTIVSICPEESLGLLPLPNKLLSF